MLRSNPQRLSKGLRKGAEIQGLGQEGVPSVTNPTAWPRVIAEKGLLWSSPPPPSSPSPLAPPPPHHHHNRNTTTTQPKEEEKPPVTEDGVIVRAVRSVRRRRSGGGGGDRTNKKRHDIDDFFFHSIMFVLPSPSFFLLYAFSAPSMSFCKEEEEDSPSTPFYAILPRSAIVVMTIRAMTTYSWWQ
ncbi:hypothetical protein PIB30_089735 [Stylosanthes scabra]|uniref:Uncharacterized protein n=1 Tax=Stylosanthes scabra TaxID=79078 RepID=A0ABU6ZSQ1_9FABA|nr:hypothetical protein [Stylosanthes scabra]